MAREGFASGDVLELGAMPSWSAAAHARNLSGAALRMGYRLEIHGAHHLGTSGALLIVSRCESMLAGALVHAVAPRPVHVVANQAMSAALRGRGLDASGDIGLSGPGAVHTQQRALAALLDDRAVAIVGSATPRGYLAARAGAPIAPVVILGAEGRVVTDPPRPRTRISVYAFEPIAIDVPGDPLRPATRAAVEEQIRQAVADAEAQAGLRSGRPPA